MHACYYNMKEIIDPSHANETYTPLSVLLLFLFLVLFFLFCIVLCYVCFNGNVKDWQALLVHNKFNLHNVNQKSQRGNLFF